MENPAPDALEPGKPFSSRVSTAGCPPRSYRASSAGGRRRWSRGAPCAAPGTRPQRRSRRSSSGAPAPAPAVQRATPAAHSAARPRRTPARAAQEPWLEAESPLRFPTASLWLRASGRGAAGPARGGCGALCPGCARPTPSSRARGRLSCPLVIRF